jgi:hypothetical protein
VDLPVPSLEWLALCACHRQDIALGIRRSGWIKWAALPCFFFWLMLMILIWLFLLGWARIVSGTFSPTEIAQQWELLELCARGLALAHGRQ